MNVINFEEAQRLGIKGTSDDDPSGRALAESAYEAGAVDQVASARSFEIEFRIVFTGERVDAERLAAIYKQHAESHPGVVEYAFTVSGP